MRLERRIDQKSQRAARLEHRAVARMHVGKEVNFHWEVLQLGPDPVATGFQQDGVAWYAQFANSWRLRAPQPTTNQLTTTGYTPDSRSSSPVLSPILS